MSAASDSSNSPNPLLDFSDLPRFDAFDPALVSPALDVLLADAHDALAQVTDSATPATWEAVVTPLDDAAERLGRAWGLVGHLSSVDDNEPLRDVHAENLQRVTQFYTKLGQSTALFAKYQEIAKDPAFASWPGARQQVINNALREFRLGGAELVSPERERFSEIQQRQAELSKQFSDNVLDSNKAFSMLISDKSRLAGLPDDVVDAAHADAKEHGHSGYRLTLQYPCYIPVMQYAEDRELREQMHRAFATLASPLAAAPIDDPARLVALDNSSVIDELLALRAEEAALLGFENAAEVSLESKMAQSPGEVVDFLADLAKRARSAGERDREERDAFAQTLGLDEVEAWDTGYVSEKLRESRYAFSDQEVKQYFQLPRVLSGLFGQAEKMFGVAIKADTASLWHDTVQFFRIERDGELIGQFYTDLFARATKRQGAWMNGARSRCQKNELTQTPVAYLVCNFQAPVGDKPALLTHDEVITLFHEFGHGLHHLLTRVDEISVSGISGVEWDAVELPSQFMENFCWEWPIVQAMSAHVDSGDSIPRELFDKMLAARNFQSGLQTLRQIEFSLFDMRIHRDWHAEMEVMDVLNEVRDEVAVLDAPEFNRFPNSFSHIFAGGYAAGYYSYKWAEVLSADAYAAFEEAASTADPDDSTRRMGHQFFEEILAVGGSRPAID